MSLDDHPKRVAEAIIRAQQTNRHITLPQTNGVICFPRTVAYYYRPHQIKNVASYSSEIVYDFSLPTNKIFHIHRIANNWYENTYSIWKVDGVSIEDRIERFISDINSPLNIKDRYLVARNNVKWITFNNSSKAIVTEVLIDGVVWDVVEWERERRRGVIG